MIRRRSNRWTFEEEGENFWPSFADLISTFVMILFVLVLLAYIQNLIVGKNLAASKSQLARSRQEIAQSQNKLSTLQIDLQQTQRAIATGNAQLEQARSQIDHQKSLINQSRDEIAELRLKLQGIAVLRIDVLNRVKKSIESVLSSNNPSGAPLVGIADNGNIVIHENLVFESNSHQIKSQGQPVLKSLAKGFATVLDDPQIRENIDVITIQGHTDERGSIAFNRDLSAKRANSVLNYIFETTPILEERFGEFFAASAYSEFRPINLDKTEEAYQQNRRIEISIVVKDGNLRNVIDTYMSSVADKTETPPAPE